MTYSIWGKLGGAGLGLALGGPLGALIGGVAGHMLVDREGALFGAPPRDLVFTTGLVALAAKMAKSDGVVVQHEVEAFERIVDVPDSEHERVKRLFDLAKDPTETASLLAPSTANAVAEEAALFQRTLRALVPATLGATERTRLDDGTVERLRALGYVADE